MRGIKKISMLMAGFCVLSFGSVADVRAQAVENNEAVLVKIGNIKSVKDKDGLVKACEFDATYYNRTDSTLNNAIVELKWVDTAIGSVIDEERTEAEAGTLSSISSADRAARRNRQRSASVTETTSSEDLQLLLDVPAVEPYKQVTVRSNLQTDRCFLLIGEAKVSVRDCSLADPSPEAVEARSTSGRARMTQNCNSLFKYVSAKDPQYYKEFKKLTVEEQRALEMTMQQKRKQDIDDEYQRVVGTMEETISTIKSIR